MEYRLTQHAEDVLAERGIRAEWLDFAIENPQKVEPDAMDPELEHRLARIREYEDRVLRVTLYSVTRPARVVTAYFDRAMKDRL